jgi:hypothetical protein
MANAICVGGELDGKIVKSDLTPPDYELEMVAKDGIPVIYIFVHNSITSNAAFHMVFAAYEKKGKK